MKMQKLHFTLVLIVSTILLQSCIYDARTRILKRDGITEANVIRGKVLLDRLWEKQGVDKLEQRNVYSFHGFDTWKGQIGKKAKIWPDLKTNLKFRYKVGKSTGQVSLLDGKRQGATLGLQDSKYYEVKNGITEFQDKDDKSNKRAFFGLSHIQYFTEILTDLRKAPIISFAGQEEFNKNQYDLVFCTWGKAEPHMEHDQYLLWINKETGLLDYLEYAVREPYLKPPGYKMIGGAIEYTDYRAIDGVLIPHDQIVYGIKKKTDRSKFLHRLRISDFQFDTFDSIGLYVD